MKKKKQLIIKKSSKKMNPSDNASKIFESISKMDLEALVVLLDEDIKSLGLNLKQSINKRCNCRTRSEDNQHTKKQQNNNNWQQPELLSNL